MARVPEPHRTLTVFLILFAVLSVAVVASAFLDIERTVNGTSLLDPAQRWTVTKMSPGSFESRADDLVTGRPLEYRLYQFDRPAFVDIDLSVFESTDGDVIEVAAGQLVATVRSSALEIELAERSTELRRAQTKLEVLKAGAKPALIERAQVAIQLAQTELRAYQPQYERQRSLIEQGASSAEEWEIAEARNELLQLDVTLAQAELAVLEAGASPEEITRAIETIAALEQELATIENMLAAENICTPITGNLHMQNSQISLLSVVNCDTMVVRILVPQRHGLLVQPGQQLRTTFAGLNTGPVYGQVVRIDRRVVITPAGPFLAVYGTIANSAGLLAEGMQGESRIYCGKTRLLRRIWNDIVTTFRQAVWSV